MGISDRQAISSIIYTENGVAVNPELNGYGAGFAAIAGGSVTTDIITIYGSATKLVRVRRLCFCGTQTTAAMRDVLFIKRSTANSGGTSTTPTVIPFDSTQAAGTAVVRAYTANATSLGTTVGTIRARKIFIAGSAASADEFSFDFGRDGLVLRGTGEGLAFNLNAVASSGLSASGCVEWTEE
jgi:hypothetical protein